MAFWNTSQADPWQQADSDPWGQSARQDRRQPRDVRHSQNTGKAAGKSQPARRWNLDCQRSTYYAGDAGIEYLLLTDNHGILHKVVRKSTVHNLPSGPHVEVHWPNQPDHTWKVALL